MRFNAFPFNSLAIDATKYDATVELIGVGATGAVGVLSFRVDVPITLDGVQGIGSAGDMTALVTSLVSPSGVSGIGSVGDMQASSTGEASPLDAAFWREYEIDRSHRAHSSVRLGGVQSIGLAGEIDAFAEEVEIVEINGDPSLIQSAEALGLDLISRVRIRARIDAISTIMGVECAVPSPMVMAISDPMVVIDQELEELALLLSVV